MEQPTISFVIDDYDYLAPLACGDVAPEGFVLQMERDTPAALDRTLNDPSIDAGELSFCRHLIRLANDDHSFVGIPFFAYRGFRHRCIYVRRESGLADLRQLQGRRIGTNEWPASGNAWTRALLREQGVPLSSISWRVGPIDNPDARRRPQGTLPPYVQLLPPGQTLLELLLAGELDALMCPVPPKGFYDVDSPIVRLFSDYKRVERDYFRRGGFYPPHHIVGIRRAVFDRDPWLASHLYAALERSRCLWMERRRVWAESTPWFLAELEEVTALMGDDWQPNGYQVNQVAVQAFCDELFAQGLLRSPVEGITVFSEFLEVANE